MFDNTARIRELNDEFRKLRMPSGWNSGKVVITSGVQNTLGKMVLEALDLVANFDAFTVDNDPHGEHAFGSIEIENHQLFWKIVRHAVIIASCAAVLAVVPISAWQRPTTPFFCYPCATQATWVKGWN